MGKWKSSRKVKPARTEILRGIISRMISAAPEAETYEVPLGLAGAIQQETHKSVAVVTFLMESPEVEANMIDVARYPMTRQEADDIVEGGAHKALQWLRPRAMDFVSFSVISGGIDMPPLMGLMVYDDFSTLELDKEPHSKLFKEIFKQVAIEHTMLKAPVIEA